LPIFKRSSEKGKREMRRTRIQTQNWILGDARKKEKEKGEKREKKKRPLLIFAAYGPRSLTEEEGDSASNKAWEKRIAA